LRLLVACAVLSSHKDSAAASIFPAHGQVVDVSWRAEDAARKLPNLFLEDALQLVHKYAERRSPRSEKAALRWLERYLTESSPRLRHFAEITTSLAERGV
jgi:hypothetical protein